MTNNLKPHQLIRNKRIEKGINQKEFAHLAGMSESEISKTENGYRKVAEKFDELGDFLDSKALATECYATAKRIKEETLYKTATYKMGKEYASIEDELLSYNQALEALEQIPDYLDSREKIVVLKEKLNIGEDNLIQRKKVRKRIIIIIAILLVASSVGIINTFTSNLKERKKQKFVESVNGE